MAGLPMPKPRLPSRASPAPIPTTIKLQVCSASQEPPAGDPWLHELKHDGHRLIVVADGRGGLRLISRNGFDRTEIFRAPFERLAGLGREMVLDGEIAAPDARGVTHLGDLQEAIARREGWRLAFFAFDLLHVDGHDIRGCAVEERKALLERVLKEADCPRVLYLSHVIGKGDRLFQSACQVGCEGVVSKRLGSRYKGGPSKDWIKCKASETGEFVVTGFKEVGPLRLEAIRVAEDRSGVLMPAGEVRFGFTGRRLWSALNPLRSGQAGRDGFVSIGGAMRLRVKHFGRHKGGWIRDGVVVGVGGGDL
jgi:bifunctional non-homologous end joining protein LigD